MNFAWHQLGFSLIEVMVAMVVVGILLVIGIPTYNKWIQNTKIRTTAESIQNGLQLARAEAIRRNTRVLFKLDGSAWTVDLDPGINNCGVDAGDASATCNIQKSSEKNANGNVALTATQTIVGFSGFGRQISVETSEGHVTPDPTVEVTLNIQDSGAVCSSTYRCLNVKVTPGGKIRMCDPQFDSTGDPQGCA